MSWRALDDENGIGIERKLSRKLFCYLELVNSINVINQLKMIL